MARAPEHVPFLPLRDGGGGEGRDEGHDENRDEGHDDESADIHDHSSRNDHGVQNRENHLIKDRASRVFSLLLDPPPLVHPFFSPPQIPPQPAKSQKSTKECYP